MPLIEILQSNPEAVSRFTINQVVATAGDGDLTDHSECSWELRDYFSQVSSAVLNNHISQCLARSFANSGLVLQDLVNELGRRLGCRVENGLYRGRTDAVGFDGLWQAPEGHSMVVEVKTSDAFSINLDVIAGYRDDLIHQESIKEPSTILIVVGRQNTGGIEDQIRGSRHVWNTRLISTDSLVELVSLKENASSEDAAEKVRGLLEPIDHIRLDGIINAVVSTADRTRHPRPKSLSREDERRKAIRKMRLRIAKIIAQRDSQSQWDNVEGTGFLPPPRLSSP